VIVCPARRRAVFVDDGLGVVTLDEPAARLHRTAIKVGHVDLPRRDRRRLIRLRRPAEAPAVLHHPARPIGLIGRVRVALDLQILL